MNTFIHTSLICFLFIVLSTAYNPFADDKHDLSDEPHETGDHHNPHYDEDALFGKDAKRLSDMSPEEGVKQLRLIVRKMDTDHDGYVSQDEMRAWLRKIQNHMTTMDAKRVWDEHGLNSDQTLTWHLYSNQAVDKGGLYEDETKADQEMHLKRDKIRWDIADENKDGALSLDEALSFLNPELFEKMHDALVQETLHDMDKNKDGFIDVEEYVADMWTPTENEPNEPDWVKSEREDFVNTRDSNKDGKLDHAEVKAWRFSPRFDYIESEVAHLFDHCDTDRDMRLTEDEVANRYDLFASSAATSYGEVLTDHDEL